MSQHNQKAVKRSFENSGFLNIHGMELQTMLGYKDPHFCDRTVETDNQSVNNGTTIYMSTEEYQRKIFSVDGKGVHWTDDINEELPIVMAGSGLGKTLIPETIPKAFLRAAEYGGDKPALRIQRDEKEYIWTWNQYKTDVFAFAKSLHKFGIRERAVVSIMGFNSPEWVISLHGTLFNNGIQSGVYTTNSADACQYQAEHSDCEAIIVDTIQQFEQYVSILPNLPKVKIIVTWGVKNLPDKYKNDPRFFTWNDFLNFGTEIPDMAILKLIEHQKPNQCIGVIYTSGTTGRPKGVMLSHDNMMFNGATMIFDQLMVAPREKQLQTEKFTVLSYLPLSHISALQFDVIPQVICGSQLYFAKPDALQGSIFDSLKWCRPTYFFAVPRIWEKIEIRLREIIMQQGQTMKQLFDWSQKPGIEKVRGVPKGTKPGFQYELANQLIYKKMQSFLGLDKCKIMMYGAAPLKQSTIDFFSGFDIPLFGMYGLSETTGATTITLQNQYALSIGGMAINGSHIKIANPDSEGQGEVLIKGRSVMIGYLKNPEATTKVIGADGYFASGDQGKLQGNWLQITGRIKELIITTGGENIAPVAVEDKFKLHCSACSNVMLLGEQQRFIAALISFKVEMDVKTGMSTTELLPETVEYFKKNLNLDLKSSEEACQHPKVIEHIQECINQTNSKLISRAAQIKKFHLLPMDFSVPGGELTPTMKLRRSETVKKYKNIVDEIYRETAKL